MQKSKKTMKNNELTNIIAYGFETYGFNVIDGNNIKTDKANITFVSLNSRLSLDTVSGVIVPSGIFEKFKDNSNYMHTNNVESFWATLKRGVYGIYHHISVEYLQSYVNEFCLRYNNRKADMFNMILKQAIY